MLSGPAIHLDFTLQDLYSLDKTSLEETFLLYVFPAGGNESVSPSFPVCRKFIYPASLPTEDKNHLARLSLQLTPQRYGFVAGNLPLAMFNLQYEHSQSENGEPVQPRSHQDDTLRVFQQLQQPQRPRVQFLSRIQDIKYQLDSRVAVLSPMDFMEHLPLVVHPETHYSKLLSKRGLAYSGLPTPASVVIDSTLTEGQGGNPQTVEAEINRMLAATDRIPLPFVLKHSGSAVTGQTAFMVRTEVEKQECKQAVAANLRKILPQINGLNCHLHPCSLVAQRMLTGEAIALSLFVTRKGRPIFIGCARQTFDDRGCWTGGAISYKDQSRLEQVYLEVARKTACYLHSNGYYGPAGIDVIAGAEDGKQYVIDANIRVTGTYHLGCMKTHFLRRGLCEALVLVGQQFKCTRKRFEDEFRDDIGRGAMVITGWSQGSSDKPSLAVITVGASTAVLLKAFVDRLYAFALRLESQ